MKGKWIAGLFGLIAVAIAVIVLWPAPDPLEGVDTVAVRVGDQPSSGRVDFDSELRVILGDRDIRIVSDEAAADMVLELTDFVVNLGDIEISLTEGSVRGQAKAICKLTDVQTGDVHVMDFRISVDNGTVRAELTPRKCGEFWKPRPGA